MNIVIAGHVDHGKSTIIGRLLADSGSLPKGKLDQVKKNCELNSRPFEYAFLLDALKDEQSQGITIDSARIFFKSEKRNYIIIDAPGHKEFLKNMISGAARAQAALLVIDANEGVCENSKRHGYMLTMLGITQIAVIINKMDLVNYNSFIFNSIKEEYSLFLKKIGLETNYFLPVSGRDGENIFSANGNINWFKGHTVLELLDEFKDEKLSDDKPFRMPVQDVYKFTEDGDNRRIIAGTVESGSIKTGDEIVFYPSGKKSVINSIENFNSEKVNKVSSGWATGLTLTEQIFIKRGEIACKSSELKPKIGRRLKSKLFWVGRNPLKNNKDYTLKIGTGRVIAKVEEIHKIIDSSDLSEIKFGNDIRRDSVVECTLIIDRAIAFDSPNEIAATSRFVIVDNYEISGGGIIIDLLPDPFMKYREDVIVRNYKWKLSKISREQREIKFQHKSQLLLITGPKGSGRQEIAKELEKYLFEKGHFAYFLGIGNIKYGLDTDLKNNEPNWEEHIRRFSEVVNIMLDSGIILLATIRDLTERDLELIKISVDATQIITVWVGMEKTTDVIDDVSVDGYTNINKSVQDILSAMISKKIIPVSSNNFDKA